MSAWRIPFNCAILAGDEPDNVAAAVAAGAVSGDGPFTRRCEAILERELGASGLTSANMIRAPRSASAADAGPGLVFGDESLVERAEIIREKPQAPAARRDPVGAAADVGALRRGALRVGSGGRRAGARRPGRLQAVVAHVPPAAALVRRACGADLVAARAWDPRAPLHLSGTACRFGGGDAQCPVTEYVSDRLLRLPSCTSMTEAEQDEVIEAVLDFRAA